MPTDAQSGGGYSRKPPPKKTVRRATKPAPTPVSRGPVSDLRSSGGAHYATKKANTYKATPHYRAVVQSAKPSGVKGHVPRVATFREQLQPTLAADLTRPTRAEGEAPSPLTEPLLSAFLHTQTPHERRVTYRNSVTPAAEREARVLWRHAAPLFGKSPNSRPPVMDVQNRPVVASNYMDTLTEGEHGKALPPSWRLVEVPASAAEDLGDKKFEGHKYALHALLHEWAHYFQSQHTLAGPGGAKAPTGAGRNVLAEGGAEAFTARHINQLLDRAGLSSQKSHGHVYGNFTKLVNRKMGPRWIDRGQFK